MLFYIGTFHNINTETNDTTIVEDVIIDPNKEYLVEPIKDGIYRIHDGEYQIMAITTGEGVIVVDYPPSMGTNIFNAIYEITDEPITHLI
ncbi:MAG: hypothetical protein ACPKPY_04070 [Nitrososphaeraceae archaeon]